MAQYDVYVNPNPASRENVPYVVGVQGRVRDQINTCLTMPLRRATAVTAGLPQRQVPRPRIAEQTYVFYPHQAVVVEPRLLKRPVASLAAQGAEIPGALDAVVCGV